MSVVGAVALTAVLFAGCGGDDPSGSAPAPAAEVAPPVASGSELPSEREIRAAQSETIPKPTTPRASAKSARVKASASTAPAAVIAEAEVAAREWLRYRFDGETPDAAVIPRELWESVPPAAPQERMRGAARTDGVKAVGAHAEGDGWIVMLSTTDPRMQDLVVQFGANGKIKQVNG